MQPFLTSFETNFDFGSYFQYHQKYWPLILPTIGFYLFSIWYGKRLMDQRPGFRMRGILFAWNSLLAAFSIIGAIRTVPDLLFVLKNHGLNHAICQKVDLNGFYGLWVTLFILSKLVELGDTAFIILRKQPLIFLHWYHHSTVLFCVFFTITRPLSTLRWYVTTNYSVHSIMYTYYALKAAGVWVPKLVSKVITTMQLIQMVIAFWITTYALIEKTSGRSCQVDDANIALGIVCYASYFLLFGNFFIKAYLTTPTEKLDRNKNQVLVKKSL